MRGVFQSPPLLKGDLGGFLEPFDLRTLMLPWVYDEGTMTKWIELWHD